MAFVTAQVAGGSRQLVENVNSVQQVAEKVGAASGYTAAVNGDEASMSDDVQDGDIVTFAKAVKGGLI